MTITEELQMINGRLRGDIDQLKKEIYLLKELDKERIKKDIDSLILQKDQEIIRLNNCICDFKKEINTLKEELAISRGENYQAMKKSGA